MITEDILAKMSEEDRKRFGINKQFTATTYDQKRMARDVQAYKDERENKLAEERHRNAVFQKLQENGEANSPHRKSSPKRKSPRSPTRKSPRSPTRKSPRSSRRSRRSRRSRKSRSRSRGRM